ncbi:MAG: hypothetical protein ACRCUY_11950 [Thermoguttaceae bacterium]
MNEKLTNSVISAIVGGLVGAAVVFFAAGKTKYDALEVGELKITKMATLFDQEGKEDVVIKEGSVLANNVVLGKKFIGTQFQGHIFVGNRMMTSPDDLMTTPMTNWKFQTEIGASQQDGGEMIIRSPKGSYVAGQPVNDGLFFRAGFDKDDKLMVFARANPDGVIAQVPFMVPGPAKTEGAENAEHAANTDAAKPADTKPAQVAEATNPAAVQ